MWSDVAGAPLIKTHLTTRVKHSPINLRSTKIDAADFSTFYLRAVVTQQESTLKAAYLQTKIKIKFEE
jgi:hypothetical protein